MLGHLDANYLRLRLLLLAHELSLVHQIHNQGDEHGIIFNQLALFLLRLGLFGLPTATRLNLTLMISPFVLIINSLIPKFYNSEQESVLTI